MRAILIVVMVVLTVFLTACQQKETVNLPSEQKTITNEVVAKCPILVERQDGEILNDYYMRICKASGGSDKACNYMRDGDSYSEKEMNVSIHTYKCDIGSSCDIRCPKEKYRNWTEFEDRLDKGY